MENTDLIVGGIGGVGVATLTYCAGESLSSVYQSLFDVTQRLKVSNTFEITVSGYKSPFRITNENMSGFVQEMTKVIEVSRSIGVTTAYIVTLMESAINFYRGWLGKGERPIAVDIVEGGLRGSAVGLILGFSNLSAESRPVQLATGATVGFAVGMMSAFLGSVAGAITHKLNKTLKEDV